MDAPDLETQSRERQSVEADDRLDSLKYRKAIAKTAFTKAKNQVFRLIEEDCTDILDRNRVKEACRKLTVKQEQLMDIFEALVEVYSSRTDRQNNMKIVEEIEKMEQEFSETVNRAQQYLDSNATKMLSDVQSSKSKINPASTKPPEDRYEQFQHTMSMAEIDAEIDRQTMLLEQELARQIKDIEGQVQNEYKRIKDQGQAVKLRIQQPVTPDVKRTAKSIKREGESLTSSVGVKYQSTPKTKLTTPTHEIGADLWKQMKRVSIPVFSGDKMNYESWKAAFTACIDNAPVTPEYKLLQLRQCLSGEALITIQNLGHSAAAYEAAKKRLERKFGGTRRKIALYLEQLERLKPMQGENPKELEKIADVVDMVIVNLEDADRDEELGNGVLYVTLQKKLSESLLVRYHRWIFENRRIESVLALRDWMLQEVEFLTTAAETIHGCNIRSDWRRKRNPQTFFGRDNKLESKACPVCDGHHGVWSCKKFKELKLWEKWNAAKQYKLCFRCLNQNHVGSSCRWTRVCGKNGCQKTHHPLLHTTLNLTEKPPIPPNKDSRKVTKTTGIATQTETETQAKDDASENNSRVHTTLKQAFKNRKELIALRTVPVILKNGSREITVNALLDDASTKTYINADVAAELGLQGTFQKATVNVLNGQVETFVTMPVDFKLKSLDGGVTYDVSALTTEKVTGDMEVVDWNQYTQKWKHLKEITFPKIDDRTTVDVLIGVDHADLLYSKQEIRGDEGEPIARLTPLGWTCIGIPTNQVPTNHTNFIHTYFLQSQSKAIDVNDSLRKFWEIEERPFQTHGIISTEDQRVVDKVKSSIKYQDGRYQVEIPWKEDPANLPKNYEMALKRLRNTEKRLNKDPELNKAYSNVIQKYITKKYIRKVPKEERKPARVWYLPHFPVLRPDRSTTKVRIVFDASAKCEEKSLNDVMYPGPKLQQDLNNVLLRFRRNPVAIVCDISEMYLRIEISPEDRNYHRFLWRSCDQSKEPEEYEFGRVVFGTSSSPFLAQFVLQQHAEKNKDLYPLAADTVENATYMDDSMDSAVDDQHAIELYEQLKELYEQADMHPHKWLSNSKVVFEHIPVQERALEVHLEDDQLPSIKTLGLQWIAEDDVFVFNGNPPKEMRLTKRTFLQKIASLFDPIGFLAPFIVQAKLLMQELWISGLDWDEQLDEDFQKKTMTWFQQLQHLNSLRIPRCLCLPGKTVVSSTLHTFVDASEKAYGAVVYARSLYDNGTKSVRLVAAKSKVAPLKTISIPRLELMSAVVGLRLAIPITSLLDIKPSHVFYWSDSMNVLGWIRNQSRNFKPFVANRIGEIQTASNPQQWRYVSSEKNSADLLSRGATISDLEKTKKWWNGPQFLEKDEEEWPSIPVKKEDCKSEEMKKSKVVKNAGDMTASPQGSNSTLTTMGTIEYATWRLDPTRFSSWLRLKRIRAWVNRFIYNCKQQKNKRTKGELTSEEINDSEIQLILLAQESAFSEEIEAVQHGKKLPKKLAESLPFDTRHPVLLPRKEWITKLIVKAYHEAGHHVCGTNHTLASLSSRFWVICGREEIREWENKCAECKRRTSKPATQMMAPLPGIRLRMSMRAFAQTAIDYGGPFITIQGRGKRRQKRYLALFTCLATRAVHLEIAYGLDTDSFLNAFYRMTSRRGLPDEVISDNGRNFVGADKELKELIQQLDTRKIQVSTVNQAIKWHFNPPYAPHFGGVHETMIKAAKRAIYAILGNANITDEELHTAFVGAEALVNSRPLTYQSANPKDETPLTPNHFLIGQIGGKFAPDSVDSTDFSLNKRWRRIQELVRHFWHRWLREWLPNLNRRHKWFYPKENLKPDDIVLVISPETPRGKWPIGKVIKIFPGKDGQIRVVRVRVGKHEFTRPITKLCPIRYD